MSHQPPVPAAATSPYPLHPEPIDPTGSHDAAPAASVGSALAQSGLSRTLVGLGAAALGVSAAAVIGGLLHVRPRKANGAQERHGGDDRGERGAADRRRVAVGEPYEVSYFARKHRISAGEARDIIRKAGSDRKAANALASKRAKKRAA